MEFETAAQELRKLIRGKVITSEPMSDHTSFRIGGPADLFIEPKDVADLQKCILYLSSISMPFMVLGNGTNLLVSDDGIRGAVIRTGGLLNGIEVQGTRIIAQAGVGLPHLCRIAAEHSLTGLEFASGIPGSVGGAISMNAGAYGKFMQDVVISCEVLTSKGDFLILDRASIGFRTKGSRFQDSDETIISATFQMEKGIREEIEAEMKRLSDIRREKQPIEYPSAGCVFKNPTEGGAGRYIDWAGLKGFRIGGAQISEKHANFIVNLGNATCQDVLELMSFAIETVRKRFGVTLQPEIRLVGPKLRVPGT